MAINFPTENLSAGTTHSHNGKVWEWNGSSWTSGLVTSYTVTGGGGINIKDDQGGTGGNPLDLGNATGLLFNGDGVQASGVGSDEKTITIPGGIQVQNDGTNLTTTCFQLNFKGSGVTASGTDATKEINIPGGGDTYSLHSLLSTGIELQVNGAGVPANRVFFDEGSNMSVTQTNTNPHTIEFEATPSGSANQLQYNDGTNFAGSNLRYDAAALDGSLAFHNSSGVFGAGIRCYHTSISGGDSSMLFYVGGTTFTFPMQLKNSGGTVGGNEVYVNGTLSKVGGSFRIPHPLPALKDTKDLVHSFLEGPQMDLIYRGKIDLVGGTAIVNIDTKAGMTEGTFVLLNRDIQCFTSNETGWTAVKGSVSGNILTITAQDNTCTDTISWMVVGERQDDTIKALNMTDADGNLIVEPDQTPIPTPN